MTTAMGLREVVDKLAVKHRIDLHEVEEAQVMGVARLLLTVTRMKIR